MNLCQIWKHFRNNLRRRESLCCHCRFVLKKYHMHSQNWENIYTFKMFIFLFKPLILLKHKFDYFRREKGLLFRNWERVFTKISRVRYFWISFFLLLALSSPSKIRKADVKLCSTFRVCVFFLIMWFRFLFIFYGPLVSRLKAIDKWHP